MYMNAHAPECAIIRVQSSPRGQNLVEYYNCKFNNFESILCDRFACDPGIQQRLLGESKLDFKQAFELAQAFHFTGREYREVDFSLVAIQQEISELLDNQVYVQIEVLKIILKGSRNPKKCAMKMKVRKNDHINFSW